MAPDSAGKRLYQVRLACGDGVRKPEPLAQFAERVKRATGRTYDPSTLSLLERDRQGWRLEDARAFAAVDPLKRGATWLSALDVDPFAGEAFQEAPFEPFDDEDEVPAKKRATGTTGKKRR